MQAILLFATVIGVGAEPDADDVKKLLTSEYYTVTWGTAVSIATDAELEIGSGSGHGGSLRWLRFKPARDGVEVLSIEMDEGRLQYTSKWPPDRAKIVVKKGQMKPADYAALLQKLAIVNSAKLKKEAKEGSITTSSNNFWVNSLLTANKKTIIDLNWAGYWGSVEEVHFAKPQAIVGLARASVEELEFKEHTLTKEERAWSSAKFIRDWKRFKVKDKETDPHWWVKERYLIIIGIVGDSSVFPTLREILGGEAKGKDRCAYQAINAATRLLDKDVREKPVEEMDVEKTRKKVLELLSDVK